MKSIKLLSSLLALTVLSPLSVYASTCDGSKIYINNQTGHELKGLLDPHHGHFVYASGVTFKNEKEFTVPKGYAFFGHMDSSSFTQGDAFANLRLYLEGQENDFVKVKIKFKSPDLAGRRLCTAEAHVTDDVGKSWQKPSADAYSMEEGKGVKAKVEISNVKFKDGVVVEK